MTDCLWVLLVGDAVNFALDVSFDNVQGCKEMRDKARGCNSAKDYKTNRLDVPSSSQWVLQKTETVPSNSCRG